MRIIIFTFISLCFFVQIKAQSPQAIPYQAIVRNASGNIISNQAVKLRFSIHDSLTTGTVVYKEIHTISTNAQGLVNVNIGQGSVQTGAFSAINWGKNGKFIQTELDALNNNTYTDLGTTQMMSVPYAMYATTATHATISDNGQQPGLSPGQMQYWNGANWVNIDAGNYGQSLIMCDGVPTWGGCLPKITQVSVSNITSNSAVCGGNVTSEGGSTVISRGVCWSTSINPLVSLSTKTTNGNGLGAFTSNILGLNPNTTYHIRAYATNNKGTVYGPDSIFTTILTLPILTTNSISNITSSTANSGGNITSDGGTPITARGVCWNTSTNPTVSLVTKTINGSGSGSYISSLSALSPNTIYYLRAYATNSLGTGYGNVISFTTIAITLPQVSTDTNVYFRRGVSTATIENNNVSNDGGSSVIERGICWSLSPNPNILSSQKKIVGAGVGNFNTQINNLLENTTYYIRAYATNSFGTGYGNQISITTLSKRYTQSNNITDIDGNVYPTITTICSQSWMQKNLNVSRYRNGDAIPQITNEIDWWNATNGAWCWYKNDSATYGATYGKLYNWYAINDPRGLSPIGWHISTNDEWSTLFTCFQNDAINLNSEEYFSGINISGMTIMPSGIRSGIIGDASFSANGSDPATISLSNFGTGFHSTNGSVYIKSGYNGTSLFLNNIFTNRGYSIRCVKD